MKKTVAREYKPRKTRLEWLEILKDKDANNLSMKQVMTMYNVSEGSIYQWISNFKKEYEEMPKTEDHVSSIIQKSISDLHNEFDNNVASVLKLEDRQNQILASINRLEQSLDLLQLSEKPEV